MFYRVPHSLLLDGCVTINRGSSIFQSLTYSGVQRLNAVDNKLYKKRGVKRKCLASAVRNPFLTALIILMVEQERIPARTAECYFNSSGFLTRFVTT